MCGILFFFCRLSSFSFLYSVVAISVCASRLAELSRSLLYSMLELFVFSRWIFSVVLNVVVKRFSTRNVFGSFLTELHFPADNLQD